MAIDAFSGSGVVSYALKASGRSVIANDHLAFAVEVARAVVVNDSETLEPSDVEEICSGNRDGRSFIRSTFRGLYFPDEDHAFLDAAWSHVDELSRAKRAMAIGALCLAAAQKQPRGVFTITTPRYDDGRRQMRMSLEDLFREAVLTFNAAVFRGSGDPGEVSAEMCSTLIPRALPSSTSIRRTPHRRTTLAASSATTFSRALPRIGGVRRSSGKRKPGRSRSDTPHSPTVCVAGSPFDRAVMIAAMTPTGQSADGTWEFGVRRTLPLDATGAWARLDALLEGDDAVGETRSETPGVVRRLTYQMPGWPGPATLQLRVMPAATGSTLAVHLERLPDAAARDAMRERWTAALEGLG